MHRRWGFSSEAEMLKALEEICLQQSSRYFREASATDIQDLKQEGMLQMMEAMTSKSPEDIVPPRPPWYGNSKEMAYLSGTCRHAMAGWWYKYKRAASYSPLKDDVECTEETNPETLLINAQESKMTMDRILKFMAQKKISA